MRPFRYHRPRNLDEALATFVGSDDPRWLAGGMTLLPTMKLRLASPSDLVDLTELSELEGLACDDTVLRVGAMTTHAEVAASDEVRARLPALARLADGIGDTQVRHRGTLGGSIANADPAADYPAAVVGLGATIVTARRRIAADEFFEGLFTTALAPEELITAVEFPLPARAAYEKFAHPASRFALTGVFVSEAREGAVRVAVTGAGSTVFRAGAFEAALAGGFSPAAIAGIEIAADALMSDVHASAEYRAALVGVMARRAVAEALQ